MCRAAVILQSSIATKSEMILGQTHSGRAFNMKPKPT